MLNYLEINMIFFQGLPFTQWFTPFIRASVCPGKFMHAKTPDAFPPFNCGGYDFFMGIFCTSANKPACRLYSSV